MKLELFDALKKTHVLLQQGWCRGAMARNSHSSKVLPWAKHATRWSLLGATMLATHNDDVLRAELGTLLTNHLHISHGRGSIASWNDSKTQSEVVKVVGALVQRVEDDVLARVKKSLALKPLPPIEPIKLATPEVQADFILAAMRISKENKSKENEAATTAAAPAPVSVQLPLLKTAPREFGALVMSSVSYRFRIFLRLRLDRVRGDFDDDFLKLTAEQQAEVVIVALAGYDAHEVNREK